MSISKPYTFVAGTKARANEVNADFDILYEQVNGNIADINTLQSNITSLSNTKANINGNPNNEFQVKDAVSDSDAVNKRTLFKYINNSLDYISGLTIYEDTGDNGDIVVTAGSCYDSTKSVVLNILTTEAYVSGGMSTDTKYYVYITSSDEADASTDIVLSTSNSSPSPTPTRYRQIGYFKTYTDENDNVKIKYIVSYGRDEECYKPSRVMLNTLHYKDLSTGNTYYADIYSDGYCEQYGNFINSLSTNRVETIEFILPFINTEYEFYRSAIFESDTETSINAQYISGCSTKTTTSVNIRVPNKSYILSYDWTAKGYIFTGDDSNAE